MKNIFAIFLLLLISVHCFSRQINVNNASQLNGKTWIAGDTIVMKNGTWLDQAIVFKSSGSALQPIVLKAQTPGLVILSGTSHINISGNFLEVSGLYFKNGNLSGTEIISFRTSSSEFANNCRITNCAIVDCNPTDNAIDSKWLSLYGSNNKVDRCSFQNKTNMGTLLVVWLQAGIVPNHTIDQNYFGIRNSNLDASGAELNGQEIIRIGDSSTSTQTSGVVVSNNFFEHCNGEIEIISNKSCGNLYNNNLFFECRGMLTLRHGNGCTVDGNYFFGNGISSSGGVRIIGENHKVYNNYFDKLHGTNSRSAICIVRGKLNSLANEYFQVKNALVAFNTMVDCSQAFSINYNSGNTYNMPPIGTVIAHNNVYNSTSSNINVNVDQTDISMDISWKNNLMNQGQYSNFTYSANQIITGKDTKLVLAGTSTDMYEPSIGSALSSYSTAEYPEIQSDIRGRNCVGNTKIPGASQITGTISHNMPMKSTVGTFFHIDNTTQLTETAQTSLLNVYVANHQLTIKVSKSGKLYIFDCYGKTIYNCELNKNITHFFSFQKGIYIVNFIDNNGKRYSEKVLLK